MRLDIKREYINQISKDEALRKILEILLEHDNRLDDLEKKPKKKQKKDFIEHLKTK